MLLQSQISEVIDAQASNLAHKTIGIERSLSTDFRIEKNFATIITGIRRCGKSTLLLQQLAKNTNDGLYLNFEDIRMTSFEIQDFQRLQKEIEKRNKNILYFDEIQSLDSWELFIRQLLDVGYQITVTGSNASLLGKELGAKLTGRHLSFELFPFSFSEFIDYSKYIDSDDSNFSDYLQLGGFPEYLKTRNSFILNQLIEDILYRDIAIRYNIRNIRQLKQLAILLLSNVGKSVSANGLRKSLDIKSTTTILEYFSYMENAYLFFFVPKFSYSIKKQVRNPDKVYSIDLGLFSENSIIFSPELGRRLENAIFLYLRRNYRDIFYFQDRCECDFVILENGICKHLIQVCYELNDFNMKREIDGLLEAMDFFNHNSGTIITLDTTDSFQIKNKEIEVVTAQKYLSI